MNPALWIVKKNQILVLIKKISNNYGGDDKAWLSEYSAEIIQSYSDNLQVALDCFWNLESQLKYSVPIICST